MLIALFILPINVYAEDYIAFDEKDGKKLLTELKYCEESIIVNESAIFALQSSLYKSELALGKCEDAAVIQVDIEKVCNEATQTALGKSNMFEEKNSECQIEKEKLEKRGPFYTQWYFWSNLGWLLAFL